MGNQDTNMCEAGKLTLNVVSATLVDGEDDWGGQQDPFCRTEINGCRAYTETKQGAGAYVEWNQEIIYTLDGSEVFGKITVLDEDTWSDDVCGSALLPVPWLVKTRGGRMTVNLYNRNKTRVTGGVTYDYLFAQG